MIEELQSISSALDFAKAMRVTIIDASNTARLAAYIVRNRKRVSRPVLSLWRIMAEFITPEEAKRAIRVGGLPVEWRADWERAIKEFAGGDLRRIQEAVFAEVGEEVARRVNAIRRKEFVFGVTRQRVIDEIEAHGAEFITRSTQAQIEAIKAALLQYVVAEALTPFELAKRLRNYIGLTERYANAVLRLERGLVAQGLGKDVIARQVEKYATFLHKVRAETIARTELAYGYNHGQLDAILQAREDGWLVGEVRKTWHTTGGPRVCEYCEEMEGEEVGVDEEFSCGVQMPPHPDHPVCCGCGLSYETRR